MPALKAGTRAAPGLLVIMGESRVSAGWAGAKAGYARPRAGGADSLAAVRGATLARMPECHNPWLAFDAVFESPTGEEAAT